jgi:hypothetical protein
MPEQDRLQEKIGKNAEGSKKRAITSRDREGAVVVA